MVEAGAHPKYLQAQMGHSTIKTTLDTYGHLFPDANRSVLDALDGITTEPADQMNDPILTPSRPKSEAEPGEKVACFQHFLNGACRDRTGDLRLAKLYSAFRAEPGQPVITRESRHFVGRLARS